MDLAPGVSEQIANTNLDDDALMKDFDPRSSVVSKFLTNAAKDRPSTREYMERLLLQENPNLMEIQEQYKLPLDGIVLKLRGKLRSYRLLQLPHFCNLYLILFKALRCVVLPLGVHGRYE